MPSEAATSEALDTLSMLKKQFDQASCDYPFLNHVLIEAPDNQRDLLNGRLVPGIGKFAEFFICMSQFRGQVFAREFGTPPPVPPRGITKFRDVTQQQLFVLSKDVARAKTPADYKPAVSRYASLVDRAGRCLEGLPAHALDIAPPDWSPLLDQSSYDALIPSFPWRPEEPDRWTGYVHWLGWSGKGGIGSRLRRRTWLNCSGPIETMEFDFCYNIETYKIISARLELEPTPEFEDVRHNFSVIDNLFMTSSMAIDAIMRLALQPPPAPASPKGPKRGKGRPRDTDPELDRRIKEERDAGVTYEELSAHFRKKIPYLKLAYARASKREQRAAKKADGRGSQGG